MREKLKLFYIILLFGGFEVYGEIKPSVCRKAKEFNYCIDYLSEKVDTTQVIYFFHGVNSDEKAWSKQKRFQKIRQYFYELNRPLPVVVSFSFGKVWYLTSKMKNNTSSGLLDITYEEVIPYIEKNVLDLSDNIKRIGLSTSMGSFNLVQLYLKDRSLFKHVVLNCPGISNMNPYGGIQSIKDYIIENNADTWRVMLALDIVRKYYNTEKAWINYYPFQVLKRGNVSHSDTTFYISGVTNDGYGVLQSNKELNFLLQEQGVETTWNLTKGKHCELDQESIFQFMKKTML